MNRIGLPLLATTALALAACTLDEGGSVESKPAKERVVRYDCGGDERIILTRRSETDDAQLVNNNGVVYILARTDAPKGEFAYRSTDRNSKMLVRGTNDAVRLVSTKGKKRDCTRAP